MADYDVIVIGGGASGMLAAGFAAQSGAQVLVAEKMPRPARKILMTGKGRCNVTNNCDPDQLIRMVKGNPKFMYSAFHQFTSQDTMELFESLGVPLETQRGNRVFPKSERAMDIADAMVRFVKQSGGEIDQLEVTALLLHEGKISGVDTKERGKISAKNVIIATGGKSYPGTGSTGDGYQLAKQVGHTITELRPSLVPIVTEETWVADVMGLSLKNVELRLYGAKAKPVFSQQGEMIFTHFGISGPLVLSASAHMKEAPNHYRVELDMKPALSLEQLDARILRDFDGNPNRDFMNSLGELLPKRLIPIVIAQSGIGERMKVHQITKTQREALGQLLKAIPLKVKELRPIEEAVITAGGVSVKEVDPKTMESKLISGLYLAGEVLDVDAYTGGYNLQVAFSTGYVAGTHAGKEEEE